MPRSLLVQEGPGLVSRPRPTIAAKGFRPFFLLSAAFAALIVPLWLLILAGALRPQDYLPAPIWHAHEMVFGFAVGVIAGFLLTAVSNWTGRNTAVGTPLLALAALWIAGRLAMLFPSLLHPVPSALVDLAFLPALAIAIGRPLVATRNRRNFVMIALLGALFLADAAVHADALGLWPGVARHATLVAVDVVVLVILLVTGRVMPAFTRNATGVSTIASVPALDVATVVAMAALTIIDVAAPDSSAAAMGAAAVAVLAIARAWGWRTTRALRHPLLWILHVGYAWVPAGLLLRAVATFVPAVPASAATHALTVGAIGSLTLGMMARVALGHTGRPLVASRAVVVAFVAITASAVTRVLAPLVAPGSYLAALDVAGALWTAAFAIYVVKYTPILCSPRVDGRPG